ncbi:MAG: hypothetical protein RLZ10_2869 [Bacteroidota bacterium]|jgi:hypothetical protein
MVVKIDKEKFHNILLKLFNSMIGRITTREDDDGKYIELYDKNYRNFADIWLKGSSVVGKRCKKLIAFHFEVIGDLERFVPVLRKKQYAKTLIDYVNYHTGIKADCVDFEYDFQHSYDEDGHEIDSSKMYKYRKRKKK